jgi:CHASE3 domain sensor protein
MSILQVIAGGSPAAARTAIDAQRAEQGGSPMAAARAARAARLALDDPQAQFSAAERRAIAELLDTRDTVVRLRLTAGQKACLEAMAEESGMTVSDFIRDKIGL